MPQDTKSPVVDDTVKRDESGRWVPGQKGGPGRGGVHKMDPVVKEMLLCACPRAAKKLIDALEATTPIVVNGAVQHVPDFNLQVKAANHILDRIHGKPAQTVSVDSTEPLKLDLTLVEMLKKLTAT